MRGENAEAFGFASAHTAPQLMELAQTEPVRILNDHERCVGHIHTHFNDGGGNQYIRFLLRKGGHDRIFLCTLHLTVQKRNFQIGEYGLLQSIRPGFRGFQVQRFAFLYRGTYHIYLVSLCNLLADEGVDAAPITFIDQESIHRFSAGGQFV